VALLSLTAFHDIMKNSVLCPRVSGLAYRKYAVDSVISDHDNALAYLLERHPETLPSYAVLRPAQQKVIRFTQCELGFNAGWLVQAEGPPSVVLGQLKSAIDEVRASSADIAFHFCHWITDLAGAEPTPFDGSEKLAAKFPPAVLRSLLECCDVVGELETLSATQVFENYLTRRWVANSKQLGPVPSNDDRIARMRLHCMGQGAANSILNAFDLLPEDDRMVLTWELAQTGFIDQVYDGLATSTSSRPGPPAFLIYYGPAWIQRAGQHDPVLALRVLAEVYRASRNAWEYCEVANVTPSVRVELLKNAELNQIALMIAEKPTFIVQQINDLEGILQWHRPDPDPVEMRTTKLSVQSCPDLCVIDSKLCHSI